MYNRTNNRYLIRNKLNTISATIKKMIINTFNKSEKISKLLIEGV